MADAGADGFGSACGVEFLEEAGDVELGGVGGDPEAEGDLLVWEALGDELEDFALAGAEGTVVWIGGGGLVDDDKAGGGGADGCGEGGAFGAAAELAEAGEAWGVDARGSDGDERELETARGGDDGADLEAVAVDDDRFGAEGGVLGEVDGAGRLADDGHADLVPEQGAQTFAIGRVAGDHEDADEVADATSTVRTRRGATRVESQTSG